MSHKLKEPSDKVLDVNVRIVLGVLWGLLTPPITLYYVSDSLLGVSFIIFLLLWLFTLLLSIGTLKTHGLPVVRAIAWSAVVGFTFTFVFIGIVAFIIKIPMCC